LDEKTLEKIEEILLEADVGVHTTSLLLERIKEEKEDPLLLLREEISSILSSKDPTLNIAPHPPTVIMVIGVNGVGKTLSIAKLSYKFKQEGQNVMVVCSDTFRAAAIDQLRRLSEQVGVEMTSAFPSADPSAVVYDALEAVKARGKDILIIDTAGRLHTKKNLIEELKKIKRVCAKKIEGAPHEVLFVLDATFGQNGLHQAEVFSRELGITGLILTKLDGTSKGGVVISITEGLGIPVKFIGVGESISDLLPFDGKEFANALLET
jgi:fused signal recognition particle receptor